MRMLRPSGVWCWMKASCLWLGQYFIFSSTSYMLLSYHVALLLKALTSVCLSVMLMDYDRSAAISGNGHMTG